MPAHKKNHFLIENLAFWQDIWRLLVSSGFDLYPSTIEETKDNRNSFVIPTESGGKSKQVANNFKKCFELTLKIWSVIQKTTKSDCIAEWNYLGNTQEKLKYFEYLDSIFWNNQNIPELLALPDYYLYIAETFRISKCVEELGWNIASPVEKMSSKSQEFLLSLESSLPEWELNNYLLNDAKGNFHWSILAKEQFLLEGTIFKDNSVFIQNIKFSTIT